MSKIILITGASSGIGKCCAEYLSQKGYIVYGTSRKPMVSQKENLHFLEMDVTNRDSIQAGVNKIIAEQGRIDVVVNNAGMGIGGALELVTSEEMKLQMDTNFMGMTNVCSVVIPIFRAQQEGKIINMSSIAGVMGIPYQGAYSASKAAVESYSECLSLELRRFNIRVIIIEPGDFCTEFTANRVVSSITQNHPAYKQSFETTLKIIEKEETNGLKPIVIARRMEKIICKKKPKFRYPVGNFVQILSIYVKRFVSPHFFQWILKVYYKM